MVNIFLTNSSVYLSFSSAPLCNLPEAQQHPCSHNSLWIHSVASAHSPASSGSQPLTGLWTHLHHNSYCSINLLKPASSASALLLGPATNSCFLKNRHRILWPSSTPANQSRYTSPFRITPDSTPANQSPLVTSPNCWHSDQRCQHPLDQEYSHWACSSCPAPSLSQGAFCSLLRAFFWGFKFMWAVCFELFSSVPLATFELHHWLIENSLCNLLRSRAAKWATALWNSASPVLSSFEVFSCELRKKCYFTLFKGGRQLGLC